MENYHDKQVTRAPIQRGFRSSLQIVMSFIKRLINEFKLTQQDLIDAGVFLRDWDE